ncbi:MAG: PilZ domain-containing protein [Polyangiaceae bacterium]|nr:PilZ domain-containing protein [Myxococcales bacterium]MCC6898411.1 PilZ domain-containing protein [Polyangiaceae bacterium]
MSRRENDRYQVWIPVKVDALREGIAVTHDASSRGVLMLTASTLDAGAPVEVALKLPDQTVPKRVTGRVVRVETNEADPHGLWPHRMAIEFDEVVPELEWVVGAGVAPERRRDPERSDS